MFRTFRSESKQAIVFLAHLESDRIVRHFQRLRDETKALLPAFLCVHGPAASASCFRDADLNVSIEDGRALLPARYDEMRPRGFPINDFCDLAYFPAMLSPKLAQFDHFWLMEYDVDFAGSWEKFFRHTMTSEADLIGTALTHRHAYPDWSHWSWFETPAGVIERNHVRGFFPLARFSRRLIETYMEAVRGGEWRGHHEATIPTIAFHHRLSIADLGFGPFCPDSWRGLHYRGVYHPPEAGPRTFIYRPVISRNYFHEDNTAFAQHGLLYHPVKVL